MVQLSEDCYGYLFTPVRASHTSGLLVLSPLLSSEVPWFTDLASDIVAVPRTPAGRPGGWGGEGWGVCDVLPCLH